MVLDSCKGSCGEATRGCAFGDVAFVKNSKEMLGGAWLLASLGGERGESLELTPSWARRLGRKLS